MGDKTVPRAGTAEKETMSVSKNGGCGDHRIREGVVARMARKVLEIGGCHVAMVGREQAWALRAVWGPPVLYRDPVRAK